MHDHARHTRQSCLNCETPLRGRWCDACGQDGDGQHNSVLHLGAELVESLTHADSRFWRTLRGLLLAPGRLSRDYIQGRQASQIPPLRLFLVALFVLFTAGTLTPSGIHLDALHADAATRQKLIVGLHGLGRGRAQQWLQLRLISAVDHPDQVLAVMREWAERFTFLMLPIEAGLLWLLTLWPRRRPLYDHLIVSLHSLSVLALLLGLSFPLPAGGGLLQLLFPVHLFRHLRGAYGGGIVTTLGRTVVLLAGMALASLALLAGLAAVGLELGARS